MFILMSYHCEVDFYKSRLWNSFLFYFIRKWFHFFCLYIQCPGLSLMIEAFVVYTIYEYLRHFPGKILHL